jgi:L-asparagine transporter-like permease
MYDAFIMSLLALLLFGAFLICVTGTFAPLLMNRANMGEVWPLLRKAAKVSIVMSGIGVVLVMISSGPTFRNATVMTATGGLFVWSFAILALLKMRKDSLDKPE